MRMYMYVAVAAAVDRDTLVMQIHYVQKIFAMSNVVLRNRI